LVCAVVFWTEKVIPAVEGTVRPEANRNVKSVVKEVMSCWVLYQAPPAEWLVDGVNEIAEPTNAPLPAVSIALEALANPFG
jgi:hypothetical protein